jgi:hypothetical protein
MENLLIKEILDGFTKVTDIKVQWRPLRQATMHGHADGIVQLSAGKNKIEMAAEGISNVQNTNIPHLMNLVAVNKDVLVIARTIPTRLKEGLQKLGVNYIDAAGNAFINHDPLFIWIDGRKEMYRIPDLKAKPISKAGLKVIFQLLLNEDYINETVREIAKTAEVSLDTVHKTIKGLKELQFLIPLNNHTLQWNKKRELYDRWMTEYEIRLKPGLHVGNFRFLNEKEFLNWKKMGFKSKLTKWGGEPAGELLTGFLKPEKLTIYTMENRLDLVKNYRIVPDPKGYIDIYDRFWKVDEPGKHTVPPLLVYTDLVNTGNRRNLETAEKVYEQYLQDKF